MPATRPATATSGPPHAPTAAMEVELCTRTLHRIGPARAAAGGEQSSLRDGGGVGSCCHDRDDQAFIELSMPASGTSTAMTHNPMRGAREGVLPPLPLPPPVSLTYLSDLRPAWLAVAFILAVGVLVLTSVQLERTSLTWPGVNLYVTIVLGAGIFAGGSRRVVTGLVILLLLCFVSCAAVHYTLPALSESSIHQKELQVDRDGCWLLTDTDMAALEPFVFSNDNTTTDAEKTAYLRSSYWSFASSYVEVFRNMTFGTDLSESSSRADVTKFGRTELARNARDINAFFPFLFSQLPTFLPDDVDAQTFEALVRKRAFEEILTRCAVSDCRTLETCWSIPSSGTERKVFEVVIDLLSQDSSTILFQGDMGRFVQAMQASIEEALARGESVDDDVSNSSACSSLHSEELYTSCLGSSDESLAESDSGTSVVSCDKCVNSRIGTASQDLQGLAYTVILGATVAVSTFGVMISSLGRSQALSARSATADLGHSRACLPHCSLHGISGAFNGS